MHLGEDGTQGGHQGSEVADQRLVLWVGSLQIDDRSHADGFHNPPVSNTQLLPKQTTVRQLRLLPVPPEQPHAGVVWRRSRSARSGDREDPLCGWV